VPDKRLLDQIFVQFPKDKQDLQPMDRLKAIAEERNRSVSYVALEAILEYLDREEPRRESIQRHTS